MLKKWATSYLVATSTTSPFYLQVNRFLLFCGFMLSHSLYLGLLSVSLLLYMLFATICKCILLHTGAYWLSYSFHIQAYMALNDIDSAVESFKKALDLAPNDGNGFLPGLWCWYFKVFYVIYLDELLICFMICMKRLILKVGISNLKTNPLNISLEIQLLFQKSETLFSYWSILVVETGVGSDSVGKIIGKSST